MELLHRLVTAEPLLALFVTIALGYLVGKIKIGSFVLGGIAGTLLIGVIIGQLGVSIDSGIKGVFFALFIYAVGFQGGPQFFHALNRRSLNQLASAFVIITFFFSYYVLRIRNPIEALACVAGGRSANPAFAALLAKAGNATPVVSFTVTYAVANVFLTLWGPLIVGIITKNAS